jgi:oxalate decarboxylase
LTVATSADVGPDDLWYFPAGIPHSIQGLSDDGCEFLLAFPDGEFSEDSTFADLFAHTNKETLVKTFAVDAKVFDQIAKEELFIFQAEPPPPLNQDAVPDQQGQVVQNMVFKLMDQPPTMSTGGSVGIADTRNFPISTCPPPMWKWRPDTCVKSTGIQMPVSGNITFRAKPE